MYVVYKYIDRFSSFHIYKILLREESHLATSAVTTILIHLSTLTWFSHHFKSSAITLVVFQRWKLRLSRLGELPKPPHRATGKARSNPWSSAIPFPLLHMEDLSSNTDDVQSMVGKQGEKDIVRRKKQICKDEICSNVTINISSHSRTRKQGLN